MAVKIKSEETLATFGAGRGQSVKLRVIEYEKIGKRVDLRKFFDDEHGTPTPTQKGVTLKVDWLPEIRKHLLDVFEREAKG